MATSVRVDEELLAVLREIATEEDRSIGQVVASAVRQYRLERFWDLVRQDYERLRADETAWQAYQDEIALLEGGSMDGLTDEPAYYSPEEEAEIRAEADRATGR